MPVCTQDRPLPPGPGLLPSDDRMVEHPDAESDGYRWRCPWCGHEWEASNG